MKNCFFTFESILNEIRADKGNSDGLIITSSIYMLENWENKEEIQNRQDNIRIINILESIEVDLTEIQEVIKDIKLYNKIALMSPINNHEN